VLLPDQVLVQQKFSPSLAVGPSFGPAKKLLSIDSQNLRKIMYYVSKYTIQINFENLNIF
jgi:hypothetical protein